MQMIMFPCSLSTPQEFFLKTACELYEELDGGLSKMYGWFNRKDVFSETCNFMPYTVGLALYRRGLLETDPPNHPAGYDLGFKATGIGRRLMELGCQKVGHVGCRVRKPKQWTYVKSFSQRGRWHILVAKNRSGFLLECGCYISNFSHPQTIGESELTDHKVCK